MTTAIPSEKLALRPYQAEALRSIVTGFREFDRQLAVLPTGAGKTILFSALAAERQPGRTLILAHREELIGQAVAKLHAATGIIAEVERGGCRASRGAPVVVASVQTLMRGTRRARWPRDHFDLVVVDEAHHVLADSYLGTLGHFGGQAQILGVTATPDRGDKKNLGRFFQNIACEVSLLDLIREGWLAPIRVQTVPLGISLDGVRSTAGDYNADDLGHALEPYLERVADILTQHRNRKIIAFLPLVEVSRRFVELCRGRGIAAEHVDGQSPDRAEILGRFRRDDTRLLANAMLLTEGYDEPSIDCVVCLRPTKVRSLYSQIVGRGTRLHPGKDHLLVLDFLWQTEEHQLIKPAHLIAEDEADAGDLTRVLGGDGFLAAARDQVEEERLEKLAAKAAEADRTAKLTERLRGNWRRTSQVLDPIELAVSLNDVHLAAHDATMEWHGQEPTPRQLETLEKFGIDGRAVRSRGHASVLLDRLFTRRRLGLATPRQARALQRFGHPHPETATFAEAKAFLSERFGSAA